MSVEYMAPLIAEIGQDVLERCVVGLLIEEGVSEGDAWRKTTPMKSGAIGDLDADVIKAMRRAASVVLTLKSNGLL